MMHNTLDQDITDPIMPIPSVFRHSKTIHVWVDGEKFLIANLEVPPELNLFIMMHWDVWLWRAGLVWKTKTNLKTIHFLDWFKNRHLNSKLVCIMLSDYRLLAMVILFIVKFKYFVRLKAINMLMHFYYLKK